ncbi:MAG: hypothetical protein OXH05_01075, partial [Acidobacteria bacterium]|nr:hypothetical protein [Acidobacteriota bacterium]
MFRLNAAVRRRKGRGVVPPGLLVVLFLAAAGGAGAQDWPMWGGTPDRNMVSDSPARLPSEWDVNSG